MNNFLAIDTSSKYLSVVAKKDDKVVEKFLPDCALNHSVVLMDVVDCAMAECGLTPEECDVFCAVTGPGSFTGIRIGIATVKGLAFGSGKSLGQVTSFEQVAYNVRMDDFCVAIDAGHDYYYACVYEGGVQTLAPCYLSRERVEGLNKKIVGFENLNLTNYTQISLEGCLYKAVMSKPDLVCKDISALYVRKSQAEENRK